MELRYHGEGEIGALTGHVFADGHCSRTGFRGLDRASWALVQVNNDGDRLRSIRGVVPPDYPQTAQASEFFAALYAAQVCFLPCTLYGDCLNVVNEYAKPSEEWGDEKMAYAGIMKQARLDNAPAKWDHFLKVKAHVDLKSDLDTRSRFLAKGNDWADKEALKAEELHQPPDLQYKNDLEGTTKKVKSILKVLANVLPLWPLTKERHKRVVKEPVAAKKVNKLPIGLCHVWFRGPEVWHCNVCRANNRGYP